MILKTLKTIVGFCRKNLGFKAKNKSAFFLCATDAMALLCSVVDSKIIKLISSWRSNDMLR